MFSIFSFIQWTVSKQSWWYKWGWGGGACWAQSVIWKYIPERRNYFQILCHWNAELKWEFESYRFSWITVEGHRHEQASPWPFPWLDSYNRLTWANLTGLPHEVVQVDCWAIWAPKQSWELWIPSDGIRRWWRIQLSNPSHRGGNAWMGTWCRYDSWPKMANQCPQGCIEWKLSLVSWCFLWPSRWLGWQWRQCGRIPNWFF